MTHSRNRKPWTEQEDSVLRSRYPDEPAAQVAEALQRTTASVYSRAKLLGLAKSEAFLSSARSGRLDGSQGMAWRFQKGDKPANAGKRVLPRGRSLKTQFRKGHEPHNKVPVGTVVMATIGYLKEKVGEPNKWVFVHRRNWEAVNGPTPRGYTLVFRDGNRENCAVENLELITREELMRRNTIHNYPEPVKGAIRANASLKRALRKAHEKQS